MKCLFEFDEYSPNTGLSSMRDFFQNGSYPNKEKILNYLKTHGECIAASTQKNSDFFTGELICGEELFFNDGTFSWTTSLIYYVDKYNLKLSDEFEKHVIKKQKK